MNKTLENLKETLEDEIKKIVKKGDITPTELESVQKAVCTIDVIENMGGGNSENMMDSYGSYRGYSRGRMPYEQSMYGDSYDHYSNRSYGGYANEGSYRNRGGRSYESYDGSYNDSYDESYRRGRSPVTGRYISRDSYPNSNRSYDDGYSGHSIKDRMVARLESMYDEAKSDHERQVVDQWIQRLRGGN